MTAAPRDGRGRIMGWQHWALLSAGFAGLTAVLAKAGAAGVVEEVASVAEMI